MFLSALRQSLITASGLARATAAAGGVLALIALAAPPAPAVLIDTGDGTGNTTAPASDPGFANVGVVNGLTGVYVGNGWVLTANHVGEHPITLGGVTYAPVAGSKVQLQTAGGANPTYADLIAFKLAEKPPLPDLQIATQQAQVGHDVMIVGNGKNRGTAVQWSGHDGWSWGPGRTLRWGTNELSMVNVLVGAPGTSTRSIRVTFDPGNPGGDHEADVVDGDSGGAVFKIGAGPTRLIGILWARQGYENQPGAYSLYGNHGWASDLYFYRNAIAAVIDQPDCADGLDEDGDGLVDYPADPGCTSASDTSEREAGLVCDDDVDADGDGDAAFPDDPGCSSAIDPSEREIGLACDDGLDQDGDGLADYPDDPGCVDASDPSEYEPSLECDNGVDEDGDGLFDHPADPGCASLLDTSELDPSVECDNGIDDDGDGLLDHPDDPGCLSVTDPDELALALVCDNGLDDDGDGTIDWADGGCDDAFDPSERGAPEECDNGLDDDGDTFFDYPDDPDCSGPTDDVELPEPGLGPMVGVGVGALAHAGGRRRRRARSARYSSTRSTR